MENKISKPFDNNISLNQIFVLNLPPTMTLSGTLVFFLYITTFCYNDFVKKKLMDFLTQQTIASSKSTIETQA